MKNMKSRMMVVLLVTLANVLSFADGAVDVGGSGGDAPSTPPLTEVSDDAEVTAESDDAQSGDYAGSEATEQSDGGPAQDAE